MTNRELVRLKIDDHLTDAHEEIEADGKTYLYELDYKPVQDASVKVDGTAQTVDTQYTLDKRTAMLKTIASGNPTALNAGKKISVDYKYAAFLDEDIDQFLLEAGDNVTVAAIKAVKVLLASSARRFDYQQGHSSMSVSQVFDHLKQMLEVLVNESTGTEGGAAGFAMGSRSVRSNPLYSDNDLSRSDNFGSYPNQWDRDI